MKAAGAQSYLGFHLQRVNGLLASDQHRKRLMRAAEEHRESVAAWRALVGDVVQRTLRPRDIPDATFRELAAEARAIWPAPWREAILDCLARRAVIGTPIGEYLPHRLARGRVCIVGDAAHVPSPMTGRGFDASALDALALAEAMQVDSAHGGADDALRRGPERVRDRDQRQHKRIDVHDIGVEGIAKSRGNGDQPRLAGRALASVDRFKLIDRAAAGRFLCHAHEDDNL